MRQYRIMFRRSGSAPGVWGLLRPIVNAALYDKPVVNAEIERIRTTPYLEGVSVRVDDEQFNIIAFDQPALAPNSFEFKEPAANVNPA